MIWLLICGAMHDLDSHCRHCPHGTQATQSRQAEKESLENRLTIACDSLQVHMAQIAHVRAEMEAVDRAWNGMCIFSSKHRVTRYVLRVKCFIARPRSIYVRILNNDHKKERSITTGLS